MDATGRGTSDQLLKVVVEQIKTPLLHIARQAELASSGGAMLDSNSVSSIADMAIKLIDSYLLSLPVLEQSELQLEPISLAAVLRTAADNLSGLAKLYDCQVELNITGRFAPVMGQQRQLEAAFTMLGFSFIEAQKPDSYKGKSRCIHLTSFKTHKGVAGGIFSTGMEFGNEELNRGLAAVGKARQTLPSISQGSGAGIFIADAILNNLASKLRVAHYHKMSGLAATLIPSRQLELLA